jgi:hypothetical protein
MAGVVFEEERMNFKGSKPQGKEPAIPQMGKSFDKCP